MKCPHCCVECNSLVLETRKQDDTIVRKRACSACGRAFLSEERASADLKMVRSRPDKLLSKRQKTVPLKTTEKGLFGVWSATNI